jgi:hypothetical protein
VIDKEIRALLPAWLAAAAALTAATGGVYPLKYFGVPLYFIAVASLGAFSIGHEYTYGTLASVLSLPVPRRRVWATKLGVLLPMLAALAALAAWRLTLDRGDRTFGVALFWLPAVAALCIAPWLTMLSRSPLAGAVFTLSLVGGSMAVSEWIGVARYGFTRDVDAFRVAFMWWAVGGLSLVGAVAGWRTFSRLEIADDRGGDVQLLAARSRVAASTAVRPRHPLVALVWKELRLQQLAFVIAAIYVTGCLGLLVSGADARTSGIVSIFSMFFVLIMPVVIGSLAAAEERQFDTHDPQLLLPMKVSTQWIVKSATAIGLSLVVATLLPFVMMSQFPPPVQFGGPTPAGLVKANTVALVLCCATASLYVSALSRSGLAALMYSIGALLVAIQFTMFVTLELVAKTYDLVANARYVHHPLFRLPSGGEAFVPLASLCLLVLWMALTNYRYANRSAARVAWHVGLVAACIVLYAVAYGAITAL